MEVDSVKHKMDRIYQQSSQFVVKEYSLLYLLFFAIGFNKIIFYAPILGLYYILKAPSLLSVKLSKPYCILATFYILFLLTTFIIGYNQLTLDSPMKTLTLLIGIIILWGIPFQYQNHETKLKLLGFFIFGLFVDNISIVIYSFLKDPIYYGYGRLISPFSMEEINSPGVSNMLAITFSYFYFYAIYQKNSVIKWFSLSIIVACFLAAIFLGGRTFFLIAAITIFVYLLAKISIKNVIYLVFLFLIIFIIFLYLLDDVYIFNKYYEFIMLRFSSGLASSRFALYNYALEMLPYHPFGGFEVNPNIYNTQWFHNIFLDTARVAGWFPLLIFCFTLLYTSRFFFYKKKKKNTIVAFVVAVVIFLTMQQDVVLEGGVSKVIIILFLSSLILIDSKVKIATK